MNENNNESYLKKELYELIKKDSKIFDFILEGGLDGVWYADLQNSGKEWMSPKFWLTLGFNPEEKEGLTSEWQEIMHPEDLREVLKENNRIFTEKNYQFDQIVRYFHKSGNIIWIRARGIAVYNSEGKPIRLLGTHSDITKIKEEEEKFKTYIEMAPDAIFIFNKDGFIIQANNAAVELSGYSKEELMKMNLDVFFESKEILQSEIKLLDNEKIMNKEYTLKDKNFMKKVIWIKSVKLEDTTFMAFARDISETKKTEFKLQESKKNLEILFEDAKKERKKAEAVSDAKTTLLLNISHELRTPLNGILGFSELLKSNLKNTDDLEMINYVADSGKRLLNLIETLIDISDIETGKEKISIEEFSFSELIKYINNEFSAQIQLKNLDYITEFNVNPEQIYLSDIIKIKKILYNMISNSLKFTEEGYIKISINEVEKNKSCILIIKLEDTGIGMTEDEQSKAYELFWQAENFLTKKYPGLGLGLPIAKNFIDKLDGRISIESQKGKGTLIIAEIPVNKYTPVSMKKTILLVEDDYISIKLIKVICSKLNYNIEVFENGKTFLKRIKDNPDFDLILMDIQMPLLNGLDITKVMRAEYNINKPIIGLSAYNDIGTKKLCFDSGMNDFIEKPIILESFIQKLKSYLS